MKYCVNCGHELAEGAQFCPSCGTPVVTTQSSATDEGTTQNQSAPAANVSETVNAEPVKESKTVSSSSEGAQSQPQLGFVGSVQYVLQHAFEFNGDVPESRKSVFWWAVLAVLIFDCVAILIPGIGWLLGWAVDILLVSATMRRLAYIGQNTKIGWLIVIPGIYIWPLALMFFDKKE